MKKILLLCAVLVMSFSFKAHASLLIPVTPPEPADTKNVIITASTLADEALVPSLASWLETTLSLTLTPDGASRGGKFKYISSRLITVNEQETLTLPLTLQVLSIDFPTDLDEYDPSPRDGDDGSVLDSIIRR